MKELIKITEQNGDKAVSARELYKFLEIDTPFRIWIKRMLEYGFTESIDYQAMNIFVRASNGVGGTNRKEYVLTLDTAKEISMIQRSEKGRQARRYFIEVEKGYRKHLQTPKETTYDLSQPKINLRGYPLYLHRVGKEVVRYIPYENENWYCIKDILTLMGGYNTGVKHVARKLFDNGRKIRRIWLKETRHASWFTNNEGVDYFLYTSKNFRNLDQPKQEGLLLLTNHHVKENPITAEPFFKRDIDLQVEEITNEVVDLMKPIISYCIRQRINNTVIN